MVQEERPRRCGEVAEVALAVHVTVVGGKTQAAKHEAGCTQKGQDKGLGKRKMKSQQRFRGGGRERKNKHKNPRRTKAAEMGNKSMSKQRIYKGDR